MGYTYRVESELYVAGKCEEGRDYTAEAYYVVAEAPDGKSYSKGWFPGCESKVHYDEDFGEGFHYFADIREEAKAEAEALLAKSSEEDPTKADGWIFLRNAYESEAYANYDSYSEYRDARYGY